MQRTDHAAASFKDRTDVPPVKVWFRDKNLPHVPVNKHIFSRSSLPRAADCCRPAAGQVGIACPHGDTGRPARLTVTVKTSFRCYLDRSASAISPLREGVAVSGWHQRHSGEDFIEITL
jgi:hypothetical protein